MDDREQPKKSLSVGGGEVSAVEKTGIGKAYCRCGKGWKCEIKRTQGPDAGKTFVSCGQNCICTIEGTEDGVPRLQQVTGESRGEEGAYCECGEGWSCTISRIEQSETTAPFAQCAGDCSCLTFT